LSTPQFHLDVTTDQDTGVVRLNLRDDDGRHLDAHAVRLGDHPPATEDDVLAAAFALAADAGTRRAEPAAVAEAVKEEPGYTRTALALLRAGGDRGDLSASSARREPRDRDQELPGLSWTRYPANRAADRIRPWLFSF